MKILQGKYNKISEYICENKYIFLFLVFFLLYFSLGLYISFYNEYVFTYDNLIFDSDSPNVCIDFFALDEYLHCRIAYHPLIMILLQPLFKLGNAIVSSNRASIFLIQSICGAITVIAVHKTLFVLTDNNKLSNLISVVYGISLSALIYTAIPERYIFAALSNSLLFLYISLFLKSKNKLNGKDYITISVLTVISFGIMPISIISNFILIIYLSVYNNKFHFKKISKDLVITASAVITEYILLKYIQNFFDLSNNFSLFSGLINEIKEFSTTVQNAIQATIIEGLYAAETTTLPPEFYGTPKEILIFKEEQSFLYLLPGIILWGSAIFCHICGCLSGKKDNPLVGTLILIVILHIVECYYYGTICSFLYSQNILVYLCILLGLLFNNNGGLSEESQPSKFSGFINVYTYILLGLFILCQFYRNFLTVVKAENIVSIDYSTDPVGSYILYAFFTTIIIFLIILLLKNIIDKKIFELKTEDKIYLSVKIFLFYILIYSVFLIFYK